MIRFTGGGPVEFLPDEEARAWLAEGLHEHAARLGEPACTPRLVLESSMAKPRDLDDLFELICSTQSEVGQRDVEFTLLELQPGAAREQIPRDFVPLGDSDGQLMHTFASGEALLIVVLPAVLKVPALVHGSIARELGRIAIARGGGHRVEPEDREADAELAAIALGLGVWVANGAYIYDNKCCGGGCGIDLSSLRAGLSLPEACFALAVDARRRGLSARVAAKHLEATQKAAFKRNAAFVERTPALLARSRAALDG
ncbi:MAG TPA: hypothetical protein VFG69_01170 [Nannocystaceae bacterium]|nr:hypothetical protein [Nannocystaceae bacterium]